MKLKIQNSNKILVSTIIALIILLICTYNSSVYANSISSALSSGGTTITTNDNQSSSLSSSGSTSSIDQNLQGTANDPTLYNANADSNTYNVTDAELTNSTETNVTSDSKDNIEALNTSTPSNYYDQALVSSANTITPNTFDVGNIINILLIVIGVLIIVFAGAILIKLRLNQ